MSTQIQLGDKSEGKSYTAKELSDYYVILNLPKDADVDVLQGKRVAIIGYDQDALFIDANNDDEEGDDEKNDDEGGEEE